MTLKAKSQELDSKPIQPTLKRMELYDKESFTLSKMSTIYSSVFIIATQTGRKFKTKVNRADNTICVTRTA